MLQALLDWADQNGYRAGWFDESIVAAASNRITKLRREGAIDELFYDRYLSTTVGSGRLLRAGENSIILVAVPRPAHIATFDTRGKSVDLILPPTYYNYSGVFDTVKQELEDLFENRVALRTIKGPFKSLATATGLARYGLNNIAYVRGFGSYVQLLAYASRIPVQVRDPDLGTRPAILDECRTCGACQRACPTGAIALERFLLHAERCVTYFSECEGTLPDSFGKAKRPCLVGCLACQTVCPVNKGLLRFEKLGIRFSEADTSFVLDSVGDHGSAPSVGAKVAALKCSDLGLEDGRPGPLLQRNLAAVLKTLA